MPKSKIVESAAELVGLCDISDIVYHSSSVIRLDGPELPPIADGLEVNEPAMRVLQQRDADGIGTRIQCRLLTPDGFYIVDASAQYRYLEEGLEVPDDVAKEFAERVGVMAVYPFLRQDIYALSAKMRLGTPLLGFLRPGDILLETDEDASKPADS